MHIFGGIPTPPGIEAPGQMARIFALWRPRIGRSQRSKAVVALEMCSHMYGITAYIGGKCHIIIVCAAINAYVPSLQMCEH